MGELDIIQTATTDLEPASRDRIDLTLDLGPLALDEQSRESFDDVIEREQYRTGPLVVLERCRIVLREGGVLQLTNLNNRAAEGGYLELVRMLLTKTGFVDIQIADGHAPLTLTARRRADIVEEYDYGMVLRELVRPEDVMRCHEFAKELYFYKDFNYDLEVSRQFDLNSDLYAIYDESGNILCVGRAAIRLPGYNCPFMHAVMDDGAHYRVPSRYRRIGEVMGLFKEGRSGVVAFKKLMEFLTQWGHGVANLDSIWTTYDSGDPYTGNYYKTKLLMEELDVRLTYRDFGGKWNLICTDKMLELRNLHRELFKR